MREICKEPEQKWDKNITIELQLKELLLLMIGLRDSSGDTTRYILEEDFGLDFRTIYDECYLSTLHSEIEEIFERHNK